MKDIEKLLLKRFSEERNISEDMSKWNDETLIDWLSSIPDTSSVMKYGNPNEIKELISLYKSEVIQNGKTLSIGLFEHEGVFDDPPEGMLERNFYISVI